MSTKTLKIGKQFRSLQFEREAVNQETRTVEMSISSEMPVERWYGNEVLSHESNAINLSRLLSGAPLLVDHNSRDHVGIVESVSLQDRRLRAVVRFGKSDRAEQIFRDVADGIRPNVSIGYMIDEMVLATAEVLDAEGRTVTPATYKATKWTPYEVSSVSIPADYSVGAGRSSEEEREITVTVTVSESLDSESMQEDCTGEQDCSCKACQTDSNTKRSMTTTIKEKKKMDETTVDVKAVETAARNAEQARVREILALGADHKMGEEARQFVENGKGVDEFRAAVLEKYGKNVKPVEVKAEIGLSDKEARKFSITKAVNALLTGDKRGAEFELECSEAAQKLSGRKAQGILVPHDVLVASRTFSALNKSTATEGGNTVATELLSGSFIELLRNKMAIAGLGATTLTGLVGDIAIPKATGGASSYWVTEAGAVTGSKPTFGQVALSPKTVGGYIDITRKLLMQSSIDVEAFVRNELQTALALAIDLAAINGDPTADEPRGILKTVGIGSVTNGADGGDVTFGKLVDLETAVAVANADVASCAYLTNAKQRGALKQRLTSDTAAGAGYIWSNDSINGYKAVATNQVPGDLAKGNGTNLSAILFGNFADLLIGLWGGLDLTIDTTTLGTSGGVRVVALQDVDIAVRRAASFAAILDAK